MILLDTNALLWLQAGHKRARPLLRFAGRLYVSPVNLLEVQFLIESGRIRSVGHCDAHDLMSDGRWILDDPLSSALFAAAVPLGWTRDPFDRLLVAHARLRRCKLATGDGELLEQLAPGERLEL